MTQLTMPAPPTATALHPRAPQLVVDAEPQGRTSASDEQWLILPPDTARWDPFILLAEDAFSTRGYPWHPHRGIQTLTYVLSGRLEHRDTAGGFGVLGTGDAQYMVAGRYAMHYELAHALQPVRTLQAWINLPAAHKLGPSGYRDLTRAAAAHIDAPGVIGHLHVGRVGRHTGADAGQFVVPISLLDLELSAGASFIHEVPGDHVAAFYVAAGTVRVGPDRRRVAHHQTAWFEAGVPGGTSVAIEADEAAVVVAYSGRPVRESVVFGGPFLMNTEAENAQAMAEFRAGRFGPIPGDPTPADAATRR